MHTMQEKDLLLTLYMDYDSIIWYDSQNQSGFPLEKVGEISGKDVSFTYEKNQSGSQR